MVEASKALKGNAALAKWVEYGVIDDITDGVVRFRHGENYDPGEVEINQAMYGWLPEVLILDIKLLVPEVPSA